jgi:hypothetical protein
MSSLSGHRRMTRRAVEELSAAHANDPLFANLARANLPYHAVLRDIVDVLSLGHWLNFGQKHHFMRRFDGQRPLTAYHENVAWIQTNALEAARLLFDRIQTRFTPVAGGPPTPAAPGQVPSRDQSIAGRMVFDGGNGDGVSWRSLGNACHALQDSFAGGHVVRRFASPPRPGDPGVIMDVLVYVGDATCRKEHRHLDEEWREATSTAFSVRGRLAIDATKDLVRMVVRTAAGAAARPAALEGWAAFQQKWLAPAPDLAARDPDAAIRFVQRLQTLLP